MGTVFAGVVAQIGKRVKSFAMGDEVFGMTGFKFGTCAEYTAVAENSPVMVKPTKATFDEAAALPFGGQTALYFLKKADIDHRENPKVLIIGATGSVGIAAVQIARHYNADITAVCSSAGQKLVQSLGINQVILYDQADSTKSANTFDIVFDAVGKTTRKQCGPLLTKGGTDKTVGGLEYALESKEQLVFLKELFETGKYQVVIDRTYPMDKVVEAHTHVDSGRKKGNVVLKMSEWKAPIH